MKLSKILDIKTGFIRTQNDFDNIQLREIRKMQKNHLKNSKNIFLRKIKKNC